METPSRPCPSHVLLGTSLTSGGKTLHSPPTHHELLGTILTSDCPGLGVIDCDSHWLINILLKDLLQHVIFLALQRHAHARTHHAQDNSLGLPHQANAINRGDEVKEGFHSSLLSRRALYHLATQH